MRRRIENIVASIILNQLDGLDIKPLKGIKGCFRCRVGDIRILFVRKQGGNTPFQIGYRGDIYKK
jgi:hypothetical protein